MMEFRVLYFSEIVQFFRKNLLGCAIVAVVVFSATLYGLLRYPTYKATASFRETKSQSDGDGALATLLQSFADAPEKTVASGVMQSSTILKRAIQQVGLQAAVPGFSDLHFPFEKPAVYTLIPIDETCYEVVGHGVGCVGKRLELGRVSWILSKMLTGPTRIEFSPMRTVVGRVRRRFKVRKNRQDLNLLHLSFKHPNRSLAISFLDALMDQYKEYLEREQEKVALAQITYLQKRRDQLMGEFAGTLDDHVTYLEQETQDAGYLGLSQEVEMLSHPQETYLSKMHQLDIELKKWRAPKLEALADHPWKAETDASEKLSMKRAMLIGDETGFSEEFDGIDLELVEALFDRCATERDQLVSAVANITKVLESIDQKGFVMASLGPMLEGDPVSQEMIAVASQLALKIADQENHAEKELRAAANQLEIQKVFLKDHLLQQKETLIDRVNLACEKLAKLRDTALNLIEKQQYNIREKLHEIGEKLQQTPAKWRKESQFKMKKELTMQIMEGLTQLSESKVFKHQTHHVQSGPLDRADAPLDPGFAYPLVLSSVGGICGAFCFFVVRMLHALGRGLPVSRPYLLERGYHVIEGAAKLERLALHIQPGEVVAMIGVAFASELKAVLKARGIKASIEEMPGVPFQWEKPSGCVLLACQTEQEAINSILLADCFVVQLQGERPEEMEVFPKQKSYFVF